MFKNVKSLLKLISKRFRTLRIEEFEERALLTVSPYALAAVSSDSLTTAQAYVGSIDYSNNSATEAEEQTLTTDLSVLFNDTPVDSNSVNTPLNSNTVVTGPRLVTVSAVEDFDSALADANASTEGRGITLQMSDSLSRAIIPVDATIVLMTADGFPIHLMGNSVIFDSSSIESGSVIESPVPGTVINNLSITGLNVSVTGITVSGQGTQEIQTMVSAVTITGDFYSGTGMEIAGRLAIVCNSTVTNTFTGVKVTGQGNTISAVTTEGNVSGLVISGFENTVTEDNVFDNLSCDAAVSWENTISTGQYLPRLWIQGSMNTKNYISAEASNVISGTIAFSDSTFSYSVATGTDLTVQTGGESDMIDLSDLDCNNVPTVLQAETSGGGLVLLPLSASVPSIMTIKGETFPHDEFLLTSPLSELTEPISWTYTPATSSSASILRLNSFNDTNPIKITGDIIIYVSGECQCPALEVTGSLTIRGTGNLKLTSTSNPISANNIDWPDFSGTVTSGTDVNLLPISIDGTSFSYSSDTTGTGWEYTSADHTLTFTSSNLSFLSISVPGYVNIKVPTPENTTDVVTISKFNVQGDVTLISDSTHTGGTINVTGRMYWSGSLARTRENNTQITHIKQNNVTIPFGLSVGGVQLSGGSALTANYESSDNTWVYNYSSKELQLINYSGQYPIIAEDDLTIHLRGSSNSIRNITVNGKLTLLGSTNLTYVSGGTIEYNDLDRSAMAGNIMYMHNNVSVPFSLPLTIGDTTIIKPGTYSGTGVFGSWLATTDPTYGNLGVTLSNYEGGPIKATGDLILYIVGDCEVTNIEVSGTLTLVGDANAVFDSRGIQSTGGIDQSGFLGTVERNGVERSSLLAKLTIGDRVINDSEMVNQIDGNGWSWRQVPGINDYVLVLENYSLGSIIADGDLSIMLKKGTSNIIYANSTVVDSIRVSNNGNLTFVTDPDTGEIPYLTINGGLFVSGDLLYKSTANTNTHPNYIVSDNHILLFTSELTNSELTNIVTSEADLRNSITAAGSSQYPVIMLARSFELGKNNKGYGDESTVNAGLRIPSQKSVTLLSCGNYTITRKSGLVQELFIVGKANEIGSNKFAGNREDSIFNVGSAGAYGMGTATITIDGGAVYTKEFTEDSDCQSNNNVGLEATKSLISVFGTLNLYSGVTLQNNDNTTNRVDGKITDNIAGGIMVYGDPADQSGSPLAQDSTLRALLTIRGATIQNCVGRNGGGINNFGTVLFFDGLIYNNYTYGSDCEGGGIRNRGYVIMGSSGSTTYNPQIKRNFCSNNAKLDVNAHIAKGGGFHNSTNGVFIFYSGMFSENYSSYYGGGIYVGGNGSSTFTIDGGTFYNNTAIKGGGVFTNSAITFSNGSITENKAETGSGMYIACVNNTKTGAMPIVSLSGNAYVNTDNNVYLEQLQSSNKNEFTPFKVTGELTHEGVVMLINLDEKALEEQLRFGRHLVEYANTDITIKENKFVLDSTVYGLVNGSQIKNIDGISEKDKYNLHLMIVIAPITSRLDYHARIGNQFFHRLSDAIEYANMMSLYEYETVGNNTNVLRVDISGNYIKRTSAPQEIVVYVIHNTALVEQAVISGNVTLVPETDKTQTACEVAYPNTKIWYDKTKSGSEQSKFNTIDFQYEAFGDYTIALTQDFPFLNLVNSEKPLELNDDSSLDDVLAKTGAFLVLDGGTFNINGSKTNVSAGRLAFDGNYQYPNSFSGFTVYGTMNMFGNTHIEKFTNQHNLAISAESISGAVLVTESGTFNMYSGNIDRCVGVMAGAIAVISKEASFNMYGGSITNCTGANVTEYGVFTDHKGAGAVINYGVFYMEAGLISENTGEIGGVINCNTFIIGEGNTIPDGTNESDYYKFIPIISENTGSLSSAATSSSLTSSRATLNYITGGIYNGTQIAFKETASNICHNNLSAYSSFLQMLATPRTVTITTSTGQVQEYESVTGYTVMMAGGQVIDNKAVETTFTDTDTGDVIEQSITRSVAGGITNDADRDMVIFKSDTQNQDAIGITAVMNHNKDREELGTELTINYDNYDNPITNTMDGTATIPPSTITIPYKMVSGNPVTYDGSDDYQLDITNIPNGNYSNCTIDTDTITENNSDTKIDGTTTIVTDLDSQKEVIRIFTDGYIAGNPVTVCTVFEILQAKMVTTTTVTSSTGAITNTDTKTENIHSHLLYTIILSKLEDLATPDDPDLDNDTDYYDYSDYEAGGRTFLDYSIFQANNGDFYKTHLNATIKQNEFDADNNVNNHYIESKVDIQRNLIVTKDGNYSTSDVTVDNTLTSFTDQAKTNSKILESNQRYMQIFEYCSLDNLMLPDNASYTIKDTYNALDTDNEGITNIKRYVNAYTYTMTDPFVSQEEEELGNFDIDHTVSTSNISENANGVRTIETANTLFFSTPSIDTPDLWAMLDRNNLLEIVVGTKYPSNFSDGSSTSVEFPGNLIITGGLISGNSTDQGAGAIMNRGTLTMTGGTIRDNICTSATTNYSSTTPIDTRSDFLVTAAPSVYTFNELANIDGINQYGTFNLGGTALIDSSNRVFLDVSDQVISIDNETGIICLTITETDYESLKAEYPLIEEYVDADNSRTGPSIVRLNTIDETQKLHTVITIIGDYENLTANENPALPGISGIENPMFTLNTAENPIQIVSEDTDPGTILVQFLVSDNNASVPHDGNEFNYTTARASVMSATDYLINKIFVHVDDLSIIQQTERDLSPYQMVDAGMIEAPQYATSYYYAEGAFTTYVRRNYLIIGEAMVTYDTSHIESIGDTISDLTIKPVDNTEYQGADQVSVLFNPMPVYFDLSLNRNKQFLGWDYNSSDSIESNPTFVNSAVGASFIILADTTLYSQWAITTATDSDNTFVVNTLRDVINPDDQWTSLREAILEANAAHVPDSDVQMVISFVEDPSDWENGIKYGVFELGGHNLVTGDEGCGDPERIAQLYGEIPIECPIVLTWESYNNDLADRNAWSYLTVDGTYSGDHLFVINIPNDAENEIERNVSFEGIVFQNANVDLLDDVNKIWYEDTLKTTPVSFNRGSGGAILNLQSDMVYIYDCEFDNNSALYGGAIANFAGTDNGTGALVTDGVVEIKTSRFNNNYAVNFGGAVANIRGVYQSQNTSYAGNEAGSLGGAVYNALGQILRLLEPEILAEVNTFTDNKAGLFGGAVYSNGWMKADLVTFTGNQAQYGGAVYADTYSVPDDVRPHGFEATAVIAGATFQNNTATQAGGAIMTATDTAIRSFIVTAAGSGSTTQTTITGNESKYGAGLWVEHASAWLTGVSITNNTGTADNGISYGGGIGVAGENGRLYLTTCTITGNSATYGGGLINFGSQIRIKNSTTVKTNTATKQGNQLCQVQNDLYYGTTAAGHNPLDPLTGIYTVVDTTQEAVFGTGANDVYNYLTIRLLQGENNDPDKANQTEFWD